MLNLPNIFQNDTDCVPSNKSITQPDSGLREAVLSFTVYPNPANREVEIVLDESIRSAGQIILRNQLGQTLLVQNFQEGEGNSSIGCISNTK